MAKTFKQKNFNNFVWTPLGSRVNTSGKFAAGVVDTGGSRVFHLDRFKFFRKFAEIFASQGAPQVSLTPAANLPPVSTTLAKMVEKFATGVADTGGKFATGVVDTCGAP
jgi:hypothetical protein